MVYKFYILLIAFGIYGNALPTNRDQLRELLIAPLIDQRDLEPQTLKNKNMEIPVYAIVVMNADTEDTKDANTYDSRKPDTNRKIDKRSAKESNDDDLETAAGSNVLRPLFVYRQQIAYKQRIKNRRNRL
ncbi:uncharacterized protein [Prorops nasuta]|uniref:uncharacterized protein n=1 Tax=Prorops nasuta TaxID=863751 RepID=UPI0034CFCE34